MRLLVFMGISGALLVGAPASAQTPPRGQSAREGAVRELAVVRALPFERLDANKDGRLQETELPITLVPAYPRADTDKSGDISPDELRAELDRLEARLARGPALDPSNPPKDWKALDRALDQFVAHHELDGVALMRVARTSSSSGILSSLNSILQALTLFSRRLASSLDWPTSRTPLGPSANCRTSFVSSMRSRAFMIALSLASAFRSF